MRSAYLGRVLGVWGLLVAAALVVVMSALAEPFDPESFGPGHDARAYWAAPLDEPYQPGSVGKESAYLYSPAFLVAMSPLRALPWPIFLGLWTSVLLAVLFWLARPLLFLPLILLTLPELWGGNISMLLAAAIVVGFAHPAAWAFALLTKVVPGVGVLWFAVRREWLKLAVSLAATALVIALTALLAPGLWRDWFALLLSSSDSSTVPGSVPVPLMWRLPLAVGVIVLAAHRGQAWLLPVGVLLAMPVLWWGSLSLLAACVALRRADIDERLEAFLWTLETRYGQRVEAQRASATP
ncbi:hypothetical protein BH23CHL8_BH23CHL8_27020 [soil metagenome]